jgi:ferrous iron transport protein A
MSISEMSPGSAFRILKVILTDEIGKRLADMGFTEGALGTVVRRSLFRGPLQIRIRSYNILIRCSEADGIHVEALD